jgi:transcriptional regulator with XRE-family HTH domain
MRGQGKNGALSVNGDEVQEVVDRIGRRLRGIRTERGMTLAQVATASGLTRAFISQLERGETSASVSSLYRICGALGVELRDLFEPPQTSLVRASERRASFLGGTGVVDYLLTPDSERRAELIETHLEPGGTADEELFTRPGDLVIAHVRHGKLEIRTESETITLDEGDTLTFDPNVPHTWRNPSRRARTVVLFVDLPAGLF